MADHHERQGEGGRTVGWTWRTRGWGGSIESEGGTTGESIIGDSEEETVGVLHGSELFLDLLDKTFGGIVSVGDGDGEEMELTGVIRRIQTEHRILLRSREGIEAVGDFHRCHSGLDDIFVGVGETVEEVRGRFGHGVSETGIQAHEMSAVVVWVLDVILSVDFIRLDMNHLWGGG